jgi:large subunit ribosomal protein L24
MANATESQIRYTKAPKPKKIKMGGHALVSEALVKKGATNLIPKCHVKRGDMVMVIAGSEKSGRGKTGKVLNVLTAQGKVVVEGINMITRATKQRTPMGQSGLIKKEGPIFASRVMLFCTSCKKPTRIAHKTVDAGKKVRVCKKCKEALDT